MTCLPVHRARTPCVGRLIVSRLATALMYAILFEEATWTL
jgi:hypothetical protein